jgi:hypothetical protein
MGGKAQKLKRFVVRLAENRVQRGLDLAGKELW